MVFLSYSLKLLSLWLTSSVFVLFANVLEVPISGEGKESVLTSFGQGPFLVVNIATRCGFTKQLDGLEAVYQRYRERGLVVVGIPTNDFGGQTPEDDEGVANFCRLNHGVTFPITPRVTVKGEKASPLFTQLIQSSSHGSEELRWNFEKFLVSRDGQTVHRFGSRVRPESRELTEALESLL